jgi:lipoprotein-releasing system ATP-binding protein
MNKRHGTTIVVVTHDLSFARSMPRVVTMKDGLVDSDERMPGREASADKADEAPPSPSSRGDAVPARAVEG